MPDSEKNHYKMLADTLNENRNKNANSTQQVEQINNLLNSSSDYWTMKNDLKMKFNSINTNGKNLFIIVKIFKKS